MTGDDLPEVQDAWREEVPCGFLEPLELRGQVQKYQSSFSPPIEHPESQVHKF